MSILFTLRKYFRSTAQAKENKKKDILYAGRSEEEKIRKNGKEVTFTEI